MGEDLIINITKLRYFKSDLDGKHYGDFYVTTTEGNYYIFLNADKVNIISHYHGQTDIGICSNQPTEKFEQEFWRKIKEVNNE